MSKYNRHYQNGKRSVTYVPRSVIAETFKGDSCLPRVMIACWYDLEERSIPGTIENGRHTAATMDVSEGCLESGAPESLTALSTMMAAGVSVLVD